MFQVRFSQEKDLQTVKEISYENRNEFGFIPGIVFEEAHKKRWLIVAGFGGGIVGFLRFRNRKDKITVIYEIICIDKMQGKGIGKMLIEELIAHCKKENQYAIQLKCPVSSNANEFYYKMGFNLVGIEEGKVKPLNIWRLDL